MASPSAAPDIEVGDHTAYMRHALLLAALSPPKPTNFRVGAVLLDPASNTIVSTGYTLELEGNTHAEQCCFLKLAQARGVAEEDLGSAVDVPLVLYTTMEPCSHRLSGNLPCAQRILRLYPLIQTVYVGVMEPDKFVTDNTGRQSLEAAGVRFVHVGGMEKEILAVATAGHNLSAS